MSRRRRTSPNQSDPRNDRRDRHHDEGNRRHFLRIRSRQRLRNSPIAADCVAELAVISEHYHSERELLVVASVVDR